MSAAATITAKRSGVYRVPARIAALRKAAGTAGLAWIDLPLHAVVDRKQFFKMCATQLKLPTYFGGNWDALADCVRDFSWLSGWKGCVLHLSGSEKFAKASADDYQTALAVLAQAADFWKGKGMPFLVFVDGGRDLPAYEQLTS